MSQSKRHSSRPLSQRIVTVSPLDRKTRAFVYDGSVFQWHTERTGRVLRKYDSIRNSMVAGEGTLCARYYITKRKEDALLLIDPSRCDERVAISTLAVCLRKEEGLRGILSNLMKR